MRRSMNQLPLDQKEQTSCDPRSDHVGRASLVKPYANTALKSNDLMKGKTWSEKLLWLAFCSRRHLKGIYG